MFFAYSFTMITPLLSPMADHVLRFEIPLSKIRYPEPEYVKIRNCAPSGTVGSLIRSLRIESGALPEDAEVSPEDISDLDSGIPADALMSKSEEPDAKLTLLARKTIEELESGIFASELSFKLDESDEQLIIGNIRRAIEAQVSADPRLVTEMIDEIHMFIGVLHLTEKPFSADSRMQ